jgi:cytidylate kinase
LLAEDELPKRELVIAVSGSHGSGRSTHAKRLAETLGLRYISSGMVFRQVAEERGLTLEEMSKLAEKNPDFDKIIDERTKEESRRSGVVVDATLAGWMTQDPDLRIYLTAPIEARIKRIAKRDGVSYEIAKSETLSRERSERERFMSYYGVDISDLSVYDLVLNTELFEADGTARILKSVVEEYLSGS